MEIRFISGQNITKQNIMQFNDVLGIVKFYLLVFNLLNYIKDLRRCRWYLRNHERRPMRAGRLNMRIFVFLILNFRMRA